MATIAFYSIFADQMSSQLKSMIGSVTDLQAELFSLNANVLTIPSSICNLDNVIESVQVSTQAQEQKIIPLILWTNISRNLLKML